MNPHRRKLLLRSAAAVAATAVCGRAFAIGGDDTSSADLHIELSAGLDEVAIRPGAKTRVWRYRAKLLAGAPAALDTSMVAPIIRVHRGQRIRVDLINNLPESTIIHWHGLHVPEDMDGHPRFAIAPGERYRYAFTVRNRAGSNWFHPHPHGRTGKQVYAGLAGLFLVSDDDEAALALPSGAFDMPLVIQDRNFDQDNQLVYSGISMAAAPQGGGMMGGRMGSMMGGMGGMGGGMAGMMGVLGDTILVNGAPDVLRPVERKAYRIRLFNACNTRTLKLAWSDNTAMQVIASDGGLLDAPVQRDYVMLAPAERVELWVDFSHWPAGAAPVLASQAFDTGMGMGSMMRSMMGGDNALANGAAFPVGRFKIGSAAVAGPAMPQRLTPIAPPQDRPAVNADRPKVFELTMGMMRWGINGQSFDMLAASDLETVKLGTQEIWEFRNDGGAMMGMTMPHSMHIHGLQFRVIGRTISSSHARGYDTVKAGLVDGGWKDTVLVMPGERVRVLLRFEDFTGLFLYHCHMLEHEDIGMMRNYRVVA
jgi:FtsP/CotA-like multicopper oxidase with cupredoxin domain